MFMRLEPDTYLQIKDIYIFCSVQPSITNIKLDTQSTPQKGRVGFDIAVPILIHLGV